MNNWKHNLLPPLAQARLMQAGSIARVMGSAPAKNRAVEEGIAAVRSEWPEYFRPEDDDGGWIPPSKGGSKQPGTTMGRKRK